MLNPFRFDSVRSNVIRSNVIRSLMASCLLPIAMAVVISPIAMGQDSGSFGELIDLDLAPLEMPELPPLEQPYIAQPGDLQAAPVQPSFSIGPIEAPADPMMQTERRSVLAAPHVTLDPATTDELLLPELTVPTPENTRADFSTVRKPRLLTPQPLPYPSDSLSYEQQRFSDRPLLRSIPFQIEFYSVNRFYGGSPYGVRPSGYGGYQPYGGYGLQGPRPSRGGPGCAR